MSGTSDVGAKKNPDKRGAGYRNHGTNRPHPARPCIKSSDKIESFKDL